MKKTSIIKSILIWIILIILSVVIIEGIQNRINKDVNYTNLVKGIKENKITEIKITYDNSTASYKEKEIEKKVQIPSMDKFIEEISKEINDGKVNVKKVEEPMLSKIFSNIFPILPFIIIIYLWISTIGGLSKNASQGGNGISFGKSKARKIDVDEKTDVNFEKVAGVKEEKEELEEIVDFLKNPDKYIKMGARIPKGVLLVGRPGTGKTLLAKAVAGEAGVPFFSISGSDFVEMYVGVGASRVRDLFEEAKQSAPCIIFIDEIDAVGRQRGAGLGGGHDEREQTLNQLLVEMDGFGTNKGVIVMAATNRPDILDKALLRAGRFDRQIVISLPDVKAREEILRVHSKTKTFAKDVNLEVIAHNTPGFAGADLENLLNEAALLTARAGKDAITNEILEEAMIKITMGPEKKSKVINEKEKKLVSYHEAGHAVVSAFLETQEKVHQISIVPRGMAGGYTMYKAGMDKSFISKKTMEESIIGLLGGRVAEGIILGDISTGASNDIERASQIARDMVMKYGMSVNVGTISYGSNEEQVFLGRDLGEHKVLSEKTAALIDEEVKNIIDNAYNICNEILNENVDKLHKVAKVLIEKEKISGEEFYKIMEMENMTEEK